MAHASHSTSGADAASTSFLGFYEFLGGSLVYRGGRPDCAVGQQNREEQIDIQCKKAFSHSDGTDSNLETLSEAETTDAGPPTPPSLGGFESEDIDNVSAAQTKSVDVKGNFRRAYVHKLSQEKVLVPSDKRPPKHQTVIIFDWDDTLLCTSYLHHRRAWPLSPDDEICLRGIESVAKQVLEKAIEVGHHVCIITNAENGWVEHSAARYAPGLLTVLEKVQIISARSAYEQFNPFHPSMWKMLAFADLQRQLDFPVITNLIALGDSEFEIKAAQAIGQEFSESLVKTIKMREKPSPGDLLKQLKLINDKFDEIVLSANNVQLRLEAKPLGGVAEIA